MNEQIINKIKELEKIKPPVSWVKTNREFLLSQIKSEEVIKKSSWLVLKNYIQFSFQLFPQRALEPVGAMLVVLGLFFGSMLIVNAALYSLPGDYLYKVKMTLEKTQLAVTASEENKAGLKIEFAKNRLAEFEKLMSRPEDALNQKENLSLVINKFKEDVNSVQNHLTNLSRKNGTVTKLAKSVDNQVNELIKNLDSKQAKLPKDIREEVRIAVNSAEGVSLSALKILVDKYQQGSEDIDEKVIIVLFQEKIANLKNRVDSLENLEVKKEIEKLLKEAENLLAKKDFSAALAKIVEAKELLDKGQLTEPSVPPVVNSDKVEAMTVPTSTESKIAPSDKTDFSSETTESVIK